MKTKSALVLRLAVVAALCVAAPLPWARAQAGNAPVPSKADALAAVARLMRVVGEGGTKWQTATPESDKKWADDMRLIVDFAQRSPDVTIGIESGLVQVDQQGPDALFVAYYLAGAVRYDLKNPAKAKDPYADLSAAVRAELMAYQYINARRKVSRPLLDNLRKKAIAGTLDKYVVEVAKKNAKAAKPSAPAKQ